MYFTKIIGNFNALFTDKTSRKRSVNHGELGQYYKPTKFIKYMYREVWSILSFEKAQPYKNINLSQVKLWIFAKLVKIIIVLLKCSRITKI